MNAQVAEALKREKERVETRAKTLKQEVDNKDKTIKDLQKEVFYITDEFLKLKNALACYTKDKHFIQKAFEFANSRGVISNHANEKGKS